MDKVIGVLNVLELLDVKPHKPVKPFIREVRYVSSSKNINELLLDLRKDGDTVAVVVDEFGGAAGLVTIEDIMEEVVEKIEDEYDDDEKPVQWVRKISKREYIVSARIEIDSLEEDLGIQLPKGKYATLAGFLLDKSGEIPHQERSSKEERLPSPLSAVLPRPSRKCVCAGDVSVLPLESQPSHQKRNYVKR